MDKHKLAVVVSALGVSLTSLVDNSYILATMWFLVAILCQRSLTKPSNSEFNYYVNIFFVGFGFGSMVIALATGRYLDAGTYAFMAAHFVGLLVWSLKPVEAK